MEKKSYALTAPSFVGSVFFQAKKTVRTTIIASLVAIILATVSYNTADAQNVLNLAGLSYLSPASAAYSLRQLSSSYTGSAIEVTRSSDNTTLNIGFTGAGYLDTNTLKTFCGSGNGTIAKWYDQSGNGNDLTQTTVASQPAIVSGGVIYRNQGLPAVYSTASNIISNPGSWIVTGDADRSMNAVLSRTGSSEPIWTGPPGGNNAFGLDNSSAAYYCPYTYGGGDNTTGAVANDVSVIMTAVRQSGTSKGYQNGSFTTQNTSTINTLTTDGIGFGQRADGISTVGYINEIFYFPAALLCSERSSLEYNQGTVYSISVPTPSGDLVATGSGATISAGGMTTSTTNNTAFGTVVIGSSNTLTYTLSNPGAFSTQVTSIGSSDATDYTVGGISLPATIAAGSSTTFTITFAPASTSTLSSTVTIGNNTCEGSYTFAITGAGVCNSPTVPTVATDNSSFCGSGTANLSITSGTLNSATAWQWYSGSCGGTAVGSGTSVAVTPTVTTTYYVRGEGGCVTPGSCGSVTVTVNALPAVTAPPSTAVCAGSSVTLSGGGAVSYSWTGGAIDGIPFIPIATTTYTVTGTGANDCTNTATTTVTVNAKPGAIGGGVTAVINTIAGTGATGYTGDGGPATAATFSLHWGGLAYDAAGNLYVADGYNNAVRKISTSGTITTIAGTGATGFSGDGGPATAAKLNNPVGLTFDASGNLYIGDFFNGRIRKINTSGTISTIAGTGTSGYNGDNRPATTAEIDDAAKVAFDGSGNTYVVDCDNNRVRKINAAGIITTVAGNGVRGYTGDGGQATAAELSHPEDVLFDAAGNMYITDEYNNTIRKVNSAGIITTIVGTGVQGFYGDGGPATAAQLYNPTDMSFDNVGDIIFADARNNVLRMVSTSGIITTLAGNGAAGYSGDGGPATAAELNGVNGLAFYGNSANLALTDDNNNRVRYINLGATVCAGATVTLTSATSGGTWSSNNNDVAVIDMTSGVATGVSGGAAEITYMLASGCYTTTNITVNALPTVSTGANAAICSGGSTPLSGSGAGTGGIYTWSPATGLSATTGMALTATLTAAATYIYTVTGINAYGCGNTATETVTVNALPNIYGMSNGGSYCAGGEGVDIQLGNSDGAGVSYALMNGATLVTTLPGVSGLLDFGSQTAVGTYTVVATNTATTCANNMSGSATVSINPLPAAYNVTGGGSYCSGGSGVIVGLDNSDAGISYQLMNGSTDEGSAVTSTGGAFSFGNQTDAGTYTVVATNTATTCTNTMSGSAGVSVNPVPAAITGAANVITNYTDALGESVSGGGWSSSNPAVAGVDASGVVTGVSSGTATITYTLEGGCYTTYGVTDADAPGAAMNFNGISDYCQNPTSSAMLTFPLTVEGWVRPLLRSDDDPGGGLNDYPNNAVSDDNPGSYGHGFGANILAGSSFITVEYHNGFERIPFPMTSGQWYHISVVYTYGEAKTYVGTQSSPAVLIDDVTFGQADPTTGSSIINIGKHNDDGGYSTRRFFMGDIDEVKIWNRALCIDEINNDMNCEVGVTPLPAGLEAYYNFNQGIAGGDNTAITTLTDVTGNGNDATISMGLTGTSSNFVTPGGVTTGVACTPYTAGDVAVSGAGNSIPDASVSTSTTNNTDFGSVTVGATGSTLSYTISNPGSAPLTVSSISVSDGADYSVSGITFPAAIAAGGSTTFAVTFAPASVGSLPATVTIGNSTCEANYTFSIAGTGAPVHYGCLPTYGDPSDACDIGISINSFSVAGAGGSTLTDDNPCNGIGYMDEIGVTPAVTVDPASGYTATIGTYSPFPETVQVWIDFNNNGIFESTESVGGLVELLGSGSFTISIPSGVAAGNYAMRVGLASGFPFGDASYPDLDPCGGGYFFGETRDYLVNVGTPVAFANPSPESITICENSAYNFSSLLEVNNATVGVTETYSVTSGPSNGTIGTGTTVASGTGVAPTGWTYTPATGFSGTDAFTIQVSNGSDGTAAMTINVTVNPLPTITTSATSVTCNTANSGTHNNGTATATVTDAAGGLGYLWSDAASQTTRIATALVAGTYTVTVTDGNHCAASATATVGQPSAVTLSATVGNVSCNGGSNGYINANATGGAWPYGYSWAPGSAGIPAYNDLLFAPAGTYTVTATDLHGCAATASYTVTQPAALTLSATITGVSCHGGSNGSITTTVGGGTAGYTYVWSGGASGANPTGLSAGTYYLTVFDAHGCSISGAYVVTQPSALSISAVTTNVNCNGGNTGSINTTVTGGTSGYHYAWSNGSSVGDPTGLAANTYTVVVTDANSCTISHAYSITQPSAISLTATTANVSCHGGSNGSINTTVSGGTAGYSYVWSNGSHLADPSGLAMGTYSVTVTDAHSCTATAAYSITQPAALTVSGTVSNVSCYGGATGSVTTSVSGGTPSYSYAWSGGCGSSVNLTGKAAGSYSVTVTDAHGCTATGAFTITQPSAALNVSSVVTNVSCNGGDNGSVATTVSGGTSSYSYLWSPGGGTSSGISGKAAGAYNVIVTDAHGCTVTGSYTITQPAAMSCSIVATPGTSVYTGGVPTNIYLGYGPQTLTLAASVTGGSGGYSYTWSSTSGTGNLSNIHISNPVFTATLPGRYIYVVTITSESGCITTCSVSICVVDAVDHSHPGNILLCHAYGCTPTTISCSPSAVLTHLPAHCPSDHLGAVGSGCTTGLSREAGDDDGEKPVVINELTVNAFPNPFNSEVHVKIQSNRMDNVDVTLYDVTGRVRDTKPNQAVESEIIMGQDLVPGIYIIEARQGEEVRKVKVVKY